MGTAQMQPNEIGAIRNQLIAALERETATTLKVLQAYPPEESELRPHPRAKNARELSWLFTLEQNIANAAVHGTLDMSGGMPEAPDSLSECVDAFDGSRKELIDVLRNGSDDQLEGTVRFFTGPQQMGDIPVVDFLHFLINDQIHHRGQFSVYLRMSGGKVPSIYGPSADEPWF